MTQTQFEALVKFRDEYKKKCEEWSALGSVLIPLQKKAAAPDTPPYPMQTPVVYNRALDEITQDDQIKIIVVGDNPGKDEQLKINNKYLVGQAGKIAQGFFSRHSALKIDFRKNAIILNKTPVHTAKTKHLKFLSKESEDAANLILQSQIWLSKNTALLAQGLGAEIWLVGYAELKEKGIFSPYRDELKKAAQALLLAQSGSVSQNCPQGQKAAASVWDKVFVYQHFSMNRFMIDLKDFCSERGGLCADGAFNESALAKNLALLGKKRRDEVFGA